MSGGWIKLYRNITHDELWLEKRRKSPGFSKLEAWIDLLLRASHKDWSALNGKDVVEIKRGQLMTSIRQLGLDWQIDRGTVKDWLNVFFKTGKVTYKISHKGSHSYIVVTILNYDQYQGFRESKVAIELADESPLSRHSSSANNNINNIKNKVIKVVLRYEMINILASNQLVCIIHLQLYGQTCGVVLPGLFLYHLYK